MQPAPDLAKIGNKPKNGLSRAAMGSVERPAQALSPLAGDDSDLQPIFRIKVSPLFSRWVCEGLRG